ncbi:YkgJ family cysteine cluster protein [Variovorax sp. KBS0712]|uniref:YkgJ family cysteine cluster protein n=1 Tax=Variovorax sp. KBS0712 TaxID=2578111 RepID=UPI001118847B|nr:YkgJ family cysteine cluster protein [Variovorax sp. KBS0712]TSD56404.1 YkgJ family cysteine cluster protein [Variovorax sp. KBS0712]
MSEFPCNRCGACCRQVYRAQATQHLDRGDGTCRHYEDSNSACSIYNERPEVCRVDRQYELHYAQQFSWAEFVQLNLDACVIIRQTVGEK